MTINPMQAQVIKDTNTPLHLIQPDYPIPYGSVTLASVGSDIDKVFSYLNEVTPYELVDSRTDQVVKNFKRINPHLRLKQGDFRLLSYEWGVTYAGMLAATEATGDPKYERYTFDRLGFIAKLYPAYKDVDYSEEDNPIHTVISPHELDHAGALCASMIKAEYAGIGASMDAMVNNFIDFIMTKQYRLDDGMLARNRPLKNTLWLDDLFMSVPALAQMGKKTGDSKYFDEAAKQLRLYSEKMFNTNKGIYMHGKVANTDVYPQFHWARANGWAIMAIVELLDVMPLDHKDRSAVLDQFKRFAQGLVSYQSGSGFWHQLLDRYDSYLETSATAIFTYSLARAINKGWLDYEVFAPVTLLGWSAVSSMINEKGQIEGVCVGTGMAFDPMFYYYRPVNVYAAHGFGPTLLAGSEIIQLLKSHPYKIEETAIQFNQR